MGFVEVCKAPDESTCSDNAVLEKAVTFSKSETWQREMQWCLLSCFLYPKELSPYLQSQSVVGQIF